MPRVFVTEDRANAGLTIQIVKTKFLADLLVFRSDGSSARAGDETNWTFVKRRDQSQLTVFVHDSGHHRPDLRIAFVSSPMQTGWMRKGHPLRGKLRGHNVAHTLT